MTLRPTRIGVMGGTFDPPHNGHLVVGVNAADQLQFDRTLFVVANEPWQKVGERDIAPAGDRLDMVAAMLAEVDSIIGFEASDIEIRRGGPTYTADTLAEIDRTSPGAELWLIVGADVSQSLPTWKRLDEVRRRAGLAVVDRGDAGPDIEALAADGWRVSRVVIPRIDVSSSEIRGRLGDGRPIEGLVPAAAIRILRERGLYART